MTSPRVRRPWLRAAGFGAAALAMIVAACEAPGPMQASPSPSAVQMQPVRTESRTALVAVSSGSRVSRADIEAAVREHYPDVLRAAARDTSSLMFVVAPDGRIEKHERLHMKRVGEAPTEGEGTAMRLRQPAGLSERDAESSVVDVITFQPGQMGAGRVEVVWVRKLSPDQVVTSTDTRRERVEQPAGETQFRTGAPRNPEWEITTEQARAYVARYLPEVARNGTTSEFVWIVTDAAGEVVEYGDSGNSEALNRHVDDVGNVQVFKGENLVFNGHEVGLIYVRLKA